MKDNILIFCKCSFGFRIKRFVNIFAYNLLFLILNYFIFVHSCEKKENDGYSVVIDAGSTGCRIYVYRYSFEKDIYNNNDNDKNINFMLHIPPVYTKRIVPAITTFAKNNSQNFNADIDVNEKDKNIDENDDNGDKQNISNRAEEKIIDDGGGAAAVGDGGERYAGSESKARNLDEYLHSVRDSLIDFFKNNNINKKDVFMFLRGTGGMRRLENNLLNNLIDKIYKNIKNWGFKDLEKNISVNMLSGEEEGVLGWLAVNNMLKNSASYIKIINICNNDKNERNKKNNENEKNEESEKNEENEKNVDTSAVVEMGGSSSQIAFELEKGFFENFDIKIYENIFEPQKKFINNYCHEQNDSIATRVPGLEDIYVFCVKNKPIILFTKTYLGFGIYKP